MSMLELKASRPPAGEFAGIRPSPGLSGGRSTVKPQGFNRVLDKVGRSQSATSKPLSRADKSNPPGCEPNLTLVGQESGAAIKTPPSPGSVDKVIAAGDESNHEAEPTGSDRAVVPENYQSITVAAAYPATAHLVPVDVQPTDKMESTSPNQAEIESIAQTQSLTDSGSLISLAPPESITDQQDQANPVSASNNGQSDTILIEQDMQDHLLPFYTVKSAAKSADSLVKIENIPDQTAAAPAGTTIGQENELSKTNESSPVKNTATNLGSDNTKPAPNLTTGLTARNQTKAEQSVAPLPPIFGEEEVATPGSGQGNRAVSPEDIRFRLMAKTQVSPGLNQVPAETDVKALLGEEIKRLRMEKPSSESSVNKVAEPLSAKIQPEVLPPETGVIRPGLNLPQPELELVTTRPPGAATVDPQDLIEQIVKKVEMVNKAFNTEMKIQLKPEFLGRMVIKIAVEEGIVTARFITESHQVKHLLENNLGALRQNLESQGLRVDRTEVNVQLPNGGAFQGDDSGRQQMWQEYAERNSYNHLPYQAEGDYEAAPETFPESVSAIAAGAGASLFGEGRLDFTI